MAWECEGPYCVPNDKGGADCSDCPLCQEAEEDAAREQMWAEEAEDRRRDNPLEPDFRRLGQ